MGIPNTSATPALAAIAGSRNARQIALPALFFKGKTEQSATTGANASAAAPAFGAALTVRLSSAPAAGRHENATPAQMCDKPAGSRFALLDAFQAA
jgi:hypothetical protein